MLIQEKSLTKNLYDTDYNLWVFLKNHTPLKCSASKSQMI
jgi:hypothetical protein